MKKMGLVLLFVLIGCTSKPPASYTFVRTNNYSQSFDEIWANIIRYFAVNNIDIKIIEKDSGIIIIEKSLISEEYADCGEPSYGELIRSRAGRLNVLVEQFDKVKVTANASYNAITTDPYGNYPRTVPCNSTGKFEKDFFEYMKQI